MATKTWTLFRHSYISQQVRKWFKITASPGNWFLCTSDRKVGSRVEKWVIALRPKKLTSEEELGRRNREEEKPCRKKKKREGKGP